MSPARIMVLAGVPVPFCDFFCCDIPFGCILHGALIICFLWVMYVFMRISPFS
jgi:hypothetical protein